MPPVGGHDEVERHPGHQQAASSVRCNTSCKHSLALLRMGEIIARNMLSWLKLSIKLLLLHLVGFFDVLLTVHLSIILVTNHLNAQIPVLQ